MSHNWAACAPPARRHELIFDTYEQLDAGAGFVLVNDHDPKPLYYQFAAEHAGQFSWDYLDRARRSGAYGSGAQGRARLRR